MGDVISSVTGWTPGGERVALADLIRSERYALVWWHPQVLTPASCKSCSGGGASEPVALLMEIYSLGCDVIGLSYESSDRLRQYQQDIGLEFPLLSVSEDAAREHGVAKVEGEPWPSIPHRVAFLVDEHLQVINTYQVHDPKAFLRMVRDDVKAGPPVSKWEPPKKSWWQRLVS